MFSINKPKGTPDVSVPIFVFDSTDGTPETGYAFNTTGIDLWYRREGGLEVSITEATQTVNGAHSDGGVVHISDGRGRLDLPDAACAVGTDGATYVEYGGTITGMIVKGGVVNLTDPANEIFTSVVLGSTGNTTTTIHVPTWTYGDSEIVDYVVGIKDVSADEWHFRIVTNWVNSTKLATVATLPFTPANASDLVVLLGYVGWNPSWDAEVQSECTDALNAYDPPTKAEMDVINGVPLTNSAFTFHFKMVDATDFATPETSITVTATRSIDGAAFGAAGGTVTEIGNGIYEMAANAADMNGGVITFRFTGTGCAATEVTVVTSAGV